MFTCEAGKKQDSSLTENNVQNADLSNALDSEKNPKGFQKYVPTTTQQVIKPVCRPHPFHQYYSSLHVPPSKMDSSLSQKKYDIETLLKPSDNIHTLRTAPYLESHLELENSIHYYGNLQNSNSYSYTNWGGGWRATQLHSFPGSVNMKSGLLHQAIHNASSVNSGEIRREGKESSENSKLVRNDGFSNLKVIEGKSYMPSYLDSRLFSVGVPAAKLPGLRAPYHVIPDYGVPLSGAPESRLFQIPAQRSINPDDVLRIRVPEASDLGNGGSETSLSEIIDPGSEAPEICRSSRTETIDSGTGRSETSLSEIIDPGTEITGSEANVLETGTMATRLSDILASRKRSLETCAPEKNASGGENLRAKISDSGGEASSDTSLPVAGGELFRARSTGARASRAPTSLELGFPDSRVPGTGVFGMRYLEMGLYDSSNPESRHNSSFNASSGHLQSIFSDSRLYENRFTDTPFSGIRSPGSSVCGFTDTESRIQEILMSRMESPCVSVVSDVRTSQSRMSTPGNPETQVRSKTPSGIGSDQATFQNVRQLETRSVGSESNPGVFGSRFLGTRAAEMRACDTQTGNQTRVFETRQSEIKSPGFSLSEPRIFGNRGPERGFTDAMANERRESVVGGSYANTTGLSDLRSVALHPENRFSTGIRPPDDGVATETRLSQTDPQDIVRQMETRSPGFALSNARILENKFSDLIVAEVQLAENKGIRGSENQLLKNAEGLGAQDTSGSSFSDSRFLFPATLVFGIRPTETSSNASIADGKSTDSKATGGRFPDNMIPKFLIPNAVFGESNGVPGSEAKSQEQKRTRTCGTQMFNSGVTDSGEPQPPEVKNVSETKTARESKSKTCDTRPRDRRSSNTKSTQTNSSEMNTSDRSLLKKRQNEVSGVEKSASACKSRGSEASKTGENEPRAASHQKAKPIEYKIFKTKGAQESKTRDPRLEETFDPVIKRIENILSESNGDASDPVMKRMQNLLSERMADTDVAETRLVDPRVTTNKHGDTIVIATSIKEPKLVISESKTSDSRSRNPVGRQIETQVRHTIILGSEAIQVNAKIPEMCDSNAVAALSGGHRSRKLEAQMSEIVVMGPSVEKPRRRDSSVPARVRATTPESGNELENGAPGTLGPGTTIREVRKRDSSVPARPRLRAKSPEPGKTKPKTESGASCKEAVSKPPEKDPAVERIVKILSDKNIPSKDLEIRRIEKILTDRPGTKPKDKINRGSESVVLVSKVHESKQRNVITSTASKVPDGAGKKMIQTKTAETVIVGTMGLETKSRSLLKSSLAKPQETGKIKTGSALVSVGYETRSRNPVVTATRIPGTKTAEPLKIKSPAKLPTGGEVSVSVVRRPKAPDAAVTITKTSAKPVAGIKTRAPDAPRLKALETTIQKVKKIQDSGPANPGTIATKPSATEARYLTRTKTPDSKTCDVKTLPGTVGYGTRSRTKTPEPVVETKKATCHETKGRVEMQRSRTPDPTVKKAKTGPVGETRARSDLVKAPEPCKGPPGSQETGNNVAVSTSRSKTSDPSLVQIKSIEVKAAGSKGAKGSDAKAGESAGTKLKAKTSAETKAPEVKRREVTESNIRSKGRIAEQPVVKARTTVEVGQVHRSVKPCGNPGVKQPEVTKAPLTSAAHEKQEKSGKVKPPVVLQTIGYDVSVIPVKRSHRDQKSISDPDLGRVKALEPGAPKTDAKPTLTVTGSKSEQCLKTCGTKTSTPTSHKIKTKESGKTQTVAKASEAISDPKQAIRTHKEDQKRPRHHDQGKRSDDGRASKGADGQSPKTPEQNQRKTKRVETPNGKTEGQASGEKTSEPSNPKSRRLDESLAFGSEGAKTEGLKTQGNKHHDGSHGLQSRTKAPQQSPENKQQGAQGAIKWKETLDGNHRLNANTTPRPVFSSKASGSGGKSQQIDEEKTPEAGGGKFKQIEVKLADPKLLISPRGPVDKPGPPETGPAHQRKAPGTEDPEIIFVDTVKVKEKDKTGSAGPKTSKGGKKQDDDDIIFVGTIECDPKTDPRKELNPRSKDAGKKAEAKLANGSGKAQAEAGQKSGKQGHEGKRQQGEDDKDGQAKKPRTLEGASEDEESGRKCPGTWRQEGSEIRDPRLREPRHVGLFGGKASDTGFGSLGQDDPKQTALDTSDIESMLSRIKVSERRQSETSDVQRIRFFDTRVPDVRVLESLFEKPEAKDPGIARSSDKPQVAVETNDVTGSREPVREKTDGREVPAARDPESTSDTHTPVPEKTGEAKVNGPEKPGTESQVPETTVQDSSEVSQSPVTDVKTPETTISEYPDISIIEVKAPEGSSLDAGLPDTTVPDTRKKTTRTRKCLLKGGVSAESRRKRYLVELSRMLSPKSAVSLLGELRPTCTYEVQEKAGRFPPIFCTRVECEGEIIGTGQALTKAESKTRAAEMAIRKIVEQTLSDAPERKRFKLNSTDEEESFEFGREKLPWIGLASFALHKLFLQWHKETSIGSAGTANSHAQKTIIESHKNGILKELPPNAAGIHPTAVLHSVLPGISFRELSRESSPNSQRVTVGYEVDGRLFTGTASNKKDARKEAAKAALSSIWGLKFR